MNFNLRNTNLYEIVSKNCSLILLALSILISISNVAVSLKTFDWPTGDEHWHYSYSDRYYKTGETERESIHNYNSTTPGIVLNVLSVKIYEKVTGNNFNKIAARFPQMIWYILLLIGTYCLAKQISSNTVAFWAVLLLSLDANLNSHASLIGSDLPFTSIMTWVFIALFSFIKSPSIYKSIILGITYGLSFCTKYSAIFMSLPIFIGFLYIALYPIREITLKRFFKIIIYSICVLFCVALVLNYAYSFVGFYQPISSCKWQSTIFKIISSNYPNLPMLVPLPFLTGLDIQHAIERNGYWNVIILGKLFPSGIWYYFIVIWCLKTPLAIIVTKLLSVITFTVNNKKFLKIKIEWLIISITFMALFYYFNFIFRTQVGMRYSFPCLPLAYLIFAGIICKTWNLKFQNIFILVITLFSLIELIPYSGNYISFTNSLVFNKRSAYKYLADSNIDWWHNYSYAQKDLASQVKNYHFEPIHIQPGNNVFKLNTITGVFRNFNQHAWVRANLEPIKHFRHTFLLYDVNNYDFRKFIESDVTLSPNPQEQIVCESLSKYQINDIQDHESEIRIPHSPNLSQFCLHVKKDTIIQIKPSIGKAIIGIQKLPNDCIGKIASDLQPIWFRLIEGNYSFCSKSQDVNSIVIKVFKESK